MSIWHRIVGIIALLTVLLVGCASPAPRSAPPNAPSSAPGTPPTPKRMTMIMARSLNGLSFAVNNYSGVFEVQDLLHAGLGRADGNDVLQPQLAEAVPTLDNGLWTLLPDGRMELTWRLKPNAAWHDGTPLTADDLVFTTRVMRDREVLVNRSPAYGLIESVEAPDARTVTARWKQSYINANGLFSMAGANSLAVPMPRHLLEPAYVESKATFHEQPYWLDKFVGTGPFRLREFADTYLVLEANERYIFGRPKVDEITVRWVTDPNTFVANILAGATDLTTGPSLSTEQALLVRDQWKDGRVDFMYRFWIRMNPQFIDASPEAIRDVRLRRALSHAMDRQQMVDTLQSGVAPVAHVYLNPNHALFREIEPSITKYDFDPRRATLLLEEMGYRKDADGMYRDLAGQRLVVEIRALESLEIQVKSMLAVADFWQRIGVGVETVAIPRQREQDRAYRSTFPGFEITRFNNDVERASMYHSAQLPTRETNFAGQNRSRYVNQELDALIDRYFATIPLAARTQALSNVIHHLTDQLVVMGLFHDPEYAVVGNRLLNVAGPRGDYAPVSWNAHEWDIRP